MLDLNKKIIRRHYEFDPEKCRYVVTEYYRNGSNSGKREATELESKEYKRSLSGPSVIGRQTELIDANDCPGRFEDSD